MIRIKTLAAVLGAAMLMAIVAACGSAAEPTSPGGEVPSPTDASQPTTPVVSQGEPVKDYVSLVDTLTGAGVTIDPAGNVSQPFFAPQGQLLTMNGVDVQTFEFASAEEAGSVAETVSADGSSIGTSHFRWIAPPHFYKAGRLIVLYVGCDGDAIDVLEEAMGPEFAGDADLSQCPQPVPPVNLEIVEALDAAEGLAVTVSGFLLADADGRVRLCSGLLESYPPQCGGDQIELLGFDASSVPDTSIPQRPSDIGTVRWTDSQITVTGIKAIGGLTEVRLSAEAPEAQQDPSPLATTEANPPITPIVSHGGPVRDHVSLVDTLRAAGATVDPAGTDAFADYFAPQGQLLTVNGERVSTFEFGSTEEANAAAEGVSADGSHIAGPVTADGTSISTAVDWIIPPHFYKAGKLIVLYVGCDEDVIDLLEVTMGPQFAGSASLSRCP